MADINSKYFSVLQSSNFKHSSSYGSNFKCGKTGKDEEFIGHFDVQLVLDKDYELIALKDLTASQQQTTNNKQQTTNK
ncbi:MAG: hypothetical protein U9R32_09750 [Bacteroidota bacterium]|nr:hypothetical protein [Bacteroidota bacterium]